METSRKTEKENKRKKKNSAEEQTKPEKKKRNNGREKSTKGMVTGIILVVVFLVGLSVLLYPSVADYINEKHASKAIVDYESMLEDLEPEDYTRIFEQADDYNKRLCDVEYPFMYADRLNGCRGINDIEGSPDKKEPVKEPGEYIVTSEQGLNVYKEPDPESETVGVIPYNETFNVSEVENSWGKTRYGNLKGYCLLDCYNATLNAAGTGIMGYITIEKIKVELPVYHGISPQVLNRSVGHMPGSSLPTGGESTHCVLSAHRGLPSARLFTDLDKLEPGDIFIIKTLDRVLTYQVESVNIVEPKEVESLYIEEGKDLCTLVTCTPYGINTHRLLIRGVRIETYVPEPDVYIPNEAYRIDPAIVAPIVAAPMLLVLLIVLLVKYSKKRRKKPDILKDLGADNDEAEELFESISEEEERQTADDSTETDEKTENNDDGDSHNE